MNRWRVLLFTFALVACTKSNPASHCDTGTCIDPAFPFCDVTGEISGEPRTCIAVACEPGSVHGCDASVGLVCNAAGNGYEQTPCSITCDVPSNTCVDTCTLHSQCSSGICKSDGTCALESEITFTDPTGSANSDCSQTAPCTLWHALELIAPTQGQYILLTSGTYTTSSTLMVGGKRILVGRGAQSTTVTNNNTGAIFFVSTGADVTFDSVRIANATSAQSGTQIDQGWGILGELSTGTRSVRIVDTLFVNNGNGTSGGAVDLGGTIELRRSTFNGNRDGAYLAGELTVDRCMFVSNSASGLLATGNFSITNSFFVRSNSGVTLQGATTTPIFAFNTVADNSTGGITCSYSGPYVPIVGEHNIIARNTPNTVGGSGNDCMFTDSIITTDLSALRFAQPDSAPYDYHLTTGSNAIDAASSSTSHDYDGDSRPKGNGTDLGADEAY